MKTNMTKRILYVLMIILCVIGICSGFGWLCYIGSTSAPIERDPGAYIPAAGLVVTAFMVWPVIKELWRRINE